MSNTLSTEKPTDQPQREQDSRALPCSAFLDAVPDELWIPTWWEMDGEPARVYALNLEKSEAANRVLMDDAY